ncbi:MAG: hypothetical protein E6094_05640 [Clostridium perfringens]|nr:hypothetical protein [Clostridium perfringens]
MKPILFNTAMVRAILDGKKTCTRRLIKNKYTNTDIKFWEHNGKKILVYAQNDVPEPKINEDGSKTMTVRYMEEIEVPYKVGDILYVRETWQEAINKESDLLEPVYYEQMLRENVIYTDLDDEPIKWRPSIHMPKKYARIFLKVTSIRAERLQEITDEGCLNEGIREFTKDGIVKKYDTEPNMHTWEKMPRTPREAFEKLWNSTLKFILKKEWNGWTNLFEFNPRVWVIEFEQVEKQEIGE